MTESVLPYVFEWGPNMVHLRKGDGFVCGKKAKKSNTLQILHLVAAENKCPSCFEKATS